MLFATLFVALCALGAARTPVLTLSPQDSTFVPPREPGACIASPDLTAGQASDLPMYVFGGWNFIFSPAVLYSDVYMTMDNVVFTETSPSAAIGPRTLGGGALLPTGDLLVFGGFSEIDAAGIEYNSLNDVWISRDQGASFALLTPNAGWTPR